MKTVTETGVRPLTKKDLDERIVQVAVELFGDETEGHDWAPVPISTAEFVRRMRPFVVYN